MPDLQLRSDRHAKLAAELLSGRHTTLKSLLLAAGYAESTAKKATAVVLGSLGAQKAISRARKTDNAKGNLARALGQIGSELAKPQDLPTLNQTAVAMSRVVSEQPDDEQPVENAHVWAEKARRRTRLLICRCLKLGMDNPQRAAAILERLSRLGVT